MESILEELYYGNISPDAGYYGKNPAYTEAVQLRERNRDNLLALMDEREKDVFEKYSEAQDDIDDLLRFDKFTYGVRLGIMLMAEIFTGNTTS